MTLIERLEIATTLMAETNAKLGASLSAAQKRIAELEGEASGVFDYFFGTIVCRASRDADMEYKLLSSLRAALAGGTASDGERVAQQQRDRGAE